MNSGERESSPWLSSFLQTKIISISLKFSIFADTLSLSSFILIVLSHSNLMAKITITKMEMALDKKNHFIRFIFFIFI
ncbi:TPA: hypothetical protein DCZ39_07800 [Patescibacteria group bacterium]|nr:hypothetical protein [Candidatus Gracilibacteria bacterium]